MKKTALFPILFLTAFLALTGCAPKAPSAEDPSSGNPSTGASSAEVPASGAPAAGSPSTGASSAEVPASGTPAAGAAEEIAGAADDTANSRSDDQSYYFNFQSKQVEENYVLSGTYYQNKSIKGLVNAEVLKETDIAITGTLNCTKGGIKLIFQEPDGTETVLLECENGSDSEETTVDLTVTAPAGKNFFYFTGTESVCDFKLNFSLPEHVSYYLSTGNPAGL